MLWVLHKETAILWTAGVKCLMSDRSTVRQSDSCMQKDNSFLMYREARNAQCLSEKNIVAKIPTLQTSKYFNWYLWGVFSFFFFNQTVKMCRKNPSFADILVLAKNIKLSWRTLGCASLTASVRVVFSALLLFLLPSFYISMVQHNLFHPIISPTGHSRAIWLSPDSDSLSQMI